MTPRHAAVLSALLLAALSGSAAAAACRGSGLDEGVTCGVAREDEAEPGAAPPALGLVQRALWYRRREVKSREDLEVPSVVAHNLSAASPTVLDDAGAGKSGAKVAPVCREDLDRLLAGVPPLGTVARSELEVFKTLELTGPGFPRCQEAAPPPAISLLTFAPKPPGSPVHEPSLQWQHRLTDDAERKNGVARWIIVGWSIVSLGILFWSVSSIFMVKRKRQAHLEGSTPVGEAKIRLCDEKAAFASGFWTWVSLGWVDGLMGRYGRSHGCPIDDRELLGDRNDHNYEPYIKFKKEWQAEVDKKGLDQASLIWALQRTIGARGCVLIVLSVLVEMAMVNIGVVMAMDYFLNYIEKMGDFKQAHPGEPVSLLEPVILVVLLIFVVPMIFRAATIMLSLLDGYYCTACQAGMAALVYEKAMLLPVGSRPESGPNEEEKGEESAMTQDSNDKPNVVQILNIDILEAFGGLLRTVVNTAVYPFIIMALFSMLVYKIQLAGFLGCLYLLPCVGTMVVLQLLSVVLWKRFQVFQDRRMKCLTETMVHIRTIKALAWERISFQRLQNARDSELACNQKSVTLFGCILATGHTMPWGALLIAMYTLKKLQGDIPAYEIIVIQRIMGSLLGAMAGLMGGFHKLVSVPNSFRRIKMFLQQPERPENIVRCPPSSPSAPALTIRGTFTFVEGSEPALKDLDIAIPKGELVAVIGEVASGKTALLQALVGELFPVGDYSLEGPAPGTGRLAYCGQVPWIFEGTLHENVVMNQNLDNERYYRALYSACLTPDLEILPGGDQVTIGTFGVRLSGGQRARVALARAAYMDSAEVVVLDDPFASVDVPTGQHIFNELLLGALMRDRTRIVATQPDPNKLQQFDRVLLMQGGRVVAAGPPAEILVCPQFLRLQSSNAVAPTSTQQIRAEVGDTAGAVRGAENTALVCSRRAAEGNVSSLRDVEGLEYFTMDTFWWWLKAAGYKNAVIFVFFVFTGRILFLSEQLVIATWIDVKMLGPVNDFAFMQVCAGVVFVFCLSTIMLFYNAGRMSVSGATTLHSTVIKTLLRAPVDKFFDKHPIGRVINRLSYDMRQVDDSIAFILLKIMEFFVGVSVVQWFILSSVPKKVAVMAIPLYVFLGFFFLIYWGATVPLVFHAKFALSKVQDLQGSVLGACVSIRANGMFADFMRRHSHSSASLMQSSYLLNFVTRAWVQSRVFFAFSVLMGIFTVGGLYCDMPMGTLGTVVSMSFAQMSEFETVSVTFANFLNTLNALQRLVGYFKVPQEGAQEKPTDPQIRRRAVLDRSALARLEVKRGLEAAACLSEGLARPAPRVVVCSQPGREPILRATADGSALEVLPGRSLADIAPGCEVLREAGDAYIVLSVNSATRNAELMAEELCCPPATVWLDLWHRDFSMGVTVRFEELTAGYGTERNVLHGIDIEVPGRCKMGFAGRTGCGKSTTLLCILRVLEPRGGRITIGGHDAGNLGLATLRSNVGLVPQDPTIFEGTWRYNVDPFGEFPTARVWEALRCVQLLPYVRSLLKGIDSEISAEGSNISFGQKQLLSLARMVIRQPPVLLLDECTSALDPSTQESAQKTLLNDFPLSTLLAVAHRVETLLDFDRVVVLDNGRVAEYGTVKEVLSIPNGIFAGMAKKGGDSANKAKHLLEC